MSKPKPPKPPKPPKGWFDLRSHMCKYIGKRLRYMAEHGQSHPHDVTNTVWVETLLKHGTVLLYHGAQDGKGMAEDDSFAAAKESLRWVADNLENLWD